MRRTERLFALAEALRAHRGGITVAALAQRFGVTERTIHRDLVSLRAADLPVKGEPGRGGGLALDRTYTLPPVNFTAREAALLVAAGEWLAAARILPFTETLRGALDKVRAALPRQGQAELERLCEALAFAGIPAHQASAAVRGAVEQALFEGRALRIQYRKRPEHMPQWRHVRLRTMVMTRTEILLNCDDLDQREARQFVLHRIEAAELLDDAPA
ncbi:MAG: HTH domain-containing protein [Myxococcales bacterium]|nr:HTH domain-containing protein [Myxococcales bacterium]MCB9548679.1 HTH domain-containing protein [Myxococcales bacterium]